jgi:asparagine synthetase B (glutamine-hydrolysing)
MFNFFSFLVAALLVWQPILLLWKIINRRNNMCGFVGMFDIEEDSSLYREKVLKMSKKIRHRGPDWSGIYQGKKVILSHERLSIVDPLSGKQPLTLKIRKLF